MKLEYPEGATPLDPNELQGLIPALSTQGELNDFEALNIEEAIHWAERSRIVRAGLLEPGTLEALHRRMFGKTWRWAGRPRLTQKSIGVEAFRISSELRNLRDDVKAWVEFESYPPDEIVARFHHRLVWVHPFANGNGRHARLASDLLSVAQRWEPFTWGSVDLVNASETRRRYIEALRSADGHDFRPLLSFVRT